MNNSISCHQTQKPYSHLCGLLFWLSDCCKLALRIHTILYKWPSADMRLLTGWAWYTGLHAEQTYTYSVLYICVYHRAIVFSSVHIVAKYYSNSHGKLALMHFVAYTVHIWVNVIHIYAHTTALYSVTRRMQDIAGQAKASPNSMIRW